MRNKEGNVGPLGSSIKEDKLRLSVDCKTWDLKGTPTLGQTEDMVPTTSNVGLLEFLQMIGVYLDSILSRLLIFLDLVLIKQLLGWF